MKTILALILLFTSAYGFANQTVECKSSKFDASKLIEGELALRLELDSAGNLQSLVRLANSWAPFQNEEDYTITETKLVFSNPKASVYDVTGEEGDQSYFNARLVIPNSKEIKSIRLEYASSGDSEGLPITRIGLDCEAK